MVREDIELSGKCYLLTIRALCRGGYISEVHILLFCCGLMSITGCLLASYEDTILVLGCILLGHNKWKRCFA